MSLLEVLRKQGIDRQFFKRLEEQRKEKARNLQEDAEFVSRSKKRPRTGFRQGNTPAHTHLPPSKATSPAADTAVAKTTSSTDANAPPRDAAGDRQAASSELVPCTGRPLALQSFQVTPGGTIVFKDSNGEDTEDARSKAERNAVNAGMLWFESPLLKPAFDYIDRQPEALQEHLNAKARIPDACACAGLRVPAHTLPLWLYHDGACHSDPANGLGFLKTGAHLSAHRIPHSPHPFPGLSST
eukprot:1157745-Pelagomonas_calceolata.AAC.3